MAARYLVPGGIGNWNSTTNWSATNGGASGASFPTSVDDVFLTTSSGSGTLTFNTTCDCLTFNATGFTGTIAGSGTFRIFGNAVTLGGTITSTSVMQVQTINATITSNAIVWTGGLTIGNNVVTITGDLTVNGNISIVGPNINGSNIYFKGNLTVNGNGGTSTSTLIANGTSNQTWSGNFRLNQNLTVSKSSGSFILSGTVGLGGAILTTNSSVVTTSSTLQIRSSCTLNTSDTTWNIITNTATATLTLTSVLNATTLALGNANLTFVGSYGFTVGTLSCAGYNANYTFASGVTYTVSSNLNLLGSSAVLPCGVLGSAVSGTKANLTVTPGATISVSYASVKDIDSSGGSNIMAVKSTILRTINWSLGNGDFFQMW